MDKQQPSKSSSAEPPSKRLRLVESDAENEPEVDDQEYEEALQKLKSEITKGGSHKRGGNNSEVKRLMEITRLKRHQWIREENPLIADVVQKFPHLSSSRWVRKFYSHHPITCI